QIPPTMKVARDNPRDAELVDEASARAWWLFFFPGLHMDLGSTADDAGIEESARHYARAIFDDAFREMHGSDGKQPRTADPTWSPLIEVRRISTAVRRRCEPSIACSMNRAVSSSWATSCCPCKAVFSKRAWSRAEGTARRACARA